MLDTVPAVAADARHPELLGGGRMPGFASAPGVPAAVLARFYGFQVRRVAAASMQTARTAQARQIAPVTRVVDVEAVGDGSATMHCLVRDAMGTVRGPGSASRSLLDVNESVPLRVGRTVVRPAGVRTARAVDVRLDVLLSRLRADETCRGSEIASRRHTSLVELAHARRASESGRGGRSAAALHDADGCVLLGAQNGVVAAQVVRLAAPVPVPLSRAAIDHAGAILGNEGSQGRVGLHVPQTTEALVVAVAQPTREDDSTTARDGADHDDR